MSFPADLAQIFAMLATLVAAGIGAVTAATTAKTVSRLRKSLKEEQLRVEVLQRAIELQHTRDHVLAETGRGVQELSPELSKSARVLLLKSLNDRAVSLTRAEVEDAKNRREP